MKLFGREPMAMIFAFAFPFFVLFILASVFGNEIETDDPEEVEVWRGVGPTDYYVPAYMGLVMASIGLITLPMRLTNYREQGVLRRFRAAGVPLPAVLGSQVAVSLGMMVIGAVGIGIASTIVYGTQGPESWPLTVAGFALSALMFAAVGVFLGSALPTARSAQGAGLVLFFVMMFISGAAAPRGVLSDSMQTLGNALPLTHVVLLLQDAWLGARWDWSAFLLVSSFLVSASALTWRLFRWG
ncbi:MAG: ABC transporter permease [Dehalococcoidia bacterium]|nr:ABC transporter permease [Dehalococcoidia bacterium]